MIVTIQAAVPVSRRQRERAARALRLALAPVARRLGSEQQELLELSIQESS